MDKKSPNTNIGRNGKNKVIDYSYYCEKQNKHNLQLIELMAYLRTVEDGLYINAINLAVSNRWRKWDQSMPIGSEFIFTEEMLYQTGYPNITEAMQIRSKVLKLLDAIQEILGK